MATSGALLMAQKQVAWVVRTTSNPENQWFQTTDPCGVTWCGVLWFPWWRGGQTHRGRGAADGSTAVQWSSALPLWCISAMSVEGVEGSAATGLLGLASNDSNDGTSMSTDAAPGSGTQTRTRLDPVEWKPKRKKKTRSAC